MTGARIPPLPREEWTDDSREVFAFWGEPNSWEEGSKTEIIQAMANHPPLDVNLCSVATPLDRYSRGAF